MSLKAAVFLHNGLGDGVNGLTLSNNLHLNGWRVDTYHNLMGTMQNWFPHLEIFSYPKIEELPRILATYDQFFVVHNDTDEFVRRLIQEGKTRFPDRMRVIYLYPSKNIVNEPYYSDCLVDPQLSVAQNMRFLSERVLHLPKSTRSNGFIPPSGIVSHRFPKRVVIHPTSAKPTRNWPKEKFLALATWLKTEGLDPIFIPGTKEGWDGVEVALFPTLDQLAGFIYESGFLIGNDSGLGHLASAMGVPTLTICRRKASAKMWAPSFHKGVVLTPSSWIPNISGFRLRDRHWQKFISVPMAKRSFLKLSAECKMAGA